MKDKDVKIGMRVIPHSKFDDTHFKDTIVYSRALLNKQKYLYVIAIIDESYKYNDKIIYILDSYKDSNCGDFYIASDFDPDLKTERLFKLKNIKNEI